MGELSPRMKRFKVAGLLGCLDGTGVTSENYKDNLMGKMEWIKFVDSHPPFMLTVDVAYHDEDSGIKKVCVAHRESQDDEDLSLYSMELRRDITDEATHWQKRRKHPAIVD